MGIHVKRVGDKTNLLEVDASDTIVSIKTMIVAEEHDKYRLIFDGKELEDQCTLSEYNIQEDSTLYMLLRNRGGEYTRYSGL